MKAFEGMGTLNDQRQLLLDEPLEIATPSRVRVILLISDEADVDGDDTPIEEVKASLRQALQEIKAGKRIPLAKMWEGIDAE